MMILKIVHRFFMRVLILSLVFGALMPADAHGRIALFQMCMLFAACLAWTWADVVEGKL